MKMNNVQKTILSISLVGMLSVLTSCGNLGILGQEIFNNTFLVDIGAKTGGSDSQISPELPQLLTLNVKNQTEYPAKIIIYIKRAQKTESFSVTLAGGQTVGKLIENCDSASDPVLSLYVPVLGDDTGNAVPVGQVFVTVDGLPVVVPASELPGVLNVRTDFDCGDKVEFVISSSFTDPDRFQVSAIVFEGNAQ